MVCWEQIELLHIQRGRPMQNNCGDESAGLADLALCSINLFRSTVRRF